MEKKFDYVQMKIFKQLMIHCVEFFNELPKVAKNKGDNISAMMKSMLRV